MRPVVKVAAIMLAIVAVGHALRLIFGVTVTAGGALIPLWVSAVAALVAGTVAILLWKDLRRP